MKTKIFRTINIVAVIFALVAQLPAATNVYQKNTLATALNAVTSTGAGTAFAMPSYGTGSPPTRFLWQVVTTGGPASISTTLQGSADNTNFYTIDTSTATAGEVRAIVDKPAKYVRANLGTLTGGTSPTVTVKFIAGD
jgi:hypothetical protein